MEIRLKTEIWTKPERFLKILVVFTILHLLTYLGSGFGVFVSITFIIQLLLFLLIYNSMSKWEKEKLEQDEDYQAWLTLEKLQKQKKN